MFILLQLSLLFLQVQGLPSGAPAQACSAIYPVGHGGSSQGLQNNPFSLDMAVFDKLGGTIYYVPEATYESETTLHRKHYLIIPRIFHAAVKLRGPHLSPCTV